MSHEMLQFIAGERRHGTSENVVSVIEPATGEVITTGYCASEDVDEAVAAAKAAFRTWSRTTPAERSALLARWAEVLTGGPTSRGREPQRGQVDQAGQRVRRPRHDRQRRLLRRDRPQSRGQGVGRVLGRSHVEHPARTDRGRRIDRPVELPAPDGPIYDAFVNRVAELMGETRIVCGGRDPGRIPEGGAYYEPTLIADAAQDSEDRAGRSVRTGPRGTTVRHR